MADRKISDLTALTAPASGDYLPIVDISEVAAASKNKRITIQSLFQGIPVNVGIGTASPSAVLDVVSAAPGVAEFNGPANASIALNSDTVSLKLQCGGEAVFGSTTNHPTTFVTNNTERLRIDSSGHVGIGTSSPTFQLMVAAPAGAQAIFLAGQTGVSNGYEINSTGSALTHSWSTASGEKVRIDSSGRLLVGTSSAPTGLESQYSKLRVTGNTVSNGTCYASFGSGGVATSLASGNVLSRVIFGSSDGDFAWIECAADATPGTNDYPGRLVFSVTADGASSPTEAMRIKNSRILNFANTPTYADNTAAKAGGLVDGDVYRKSDGSLMIVYT